jgi:hypothetical protein
MRDRAVSQTLNYTLTLGISAILVVGLLTVGGDFVESQRDGVVNSELEVIGERLAGDIATADRLVQVGGGATTVNVTASLPRRVSGATYEVAVRTSDGNASLELKSDVLDESVTTPLSNRTAVAATSLSGGVFEISYNRSADKLVVEDA